MADSALVVVAYALQSARGTPATGAFTAVPINSDSLSAETQTVQSARRSVDRIAGASFPAGQTAAGDLGVEFSEDIFDDFLVMAMGSQWDTTDVAVDTLRLGTDFTYATIAKQYPYIPTDPNFVGGQTGEFEVYQDCVASSFSLTLADQQIIGATIGIGAGLVTFPVAAPWATLNAAPDRPSLVVCSSLQDVQIGGQPVVSAISNLTFELTNATREERDLRQCAPVGQAVGAATISGTVDALHSPESSQWFQQALANTASSVEFTVNGGTKTYRFEVPTAANTASSPDSSGDDVTSSFPYGAYNLSPIIHRSK